MYDERNFVACRLCACKKKDKMDDENDMPPLVEPSSSVETISQQPSNPVPPNPTLNPIAVDLASQAYPLSISVPLHQNQIIASSDIAGVPERTNLLEHHEQQQNWLGEFIYETETITDDEDADMEVGGSLETQEVARGAGGSLEQEQLVRNLMDLINPPSEDAIYVGEFLGRMLGSAAERSSAVSLRVGSGGTGGGNLATSSGSGASDDLASRVSLGVLRALSSTSSYSIVPPQPQPIGKTNYAIDSLTGAPLPETAKTIVVQENETYEVDCLSDFLVTMHEVRSPVTGALFTEKEIERIADTQALPIKNRLLVILKEAKDATVDAHVNVSKLKSSMAAVKSKYFEDTIYTMILHCLSICELDQVTNAHISLQEFNRRYFPTVIRAFSGLSLSNPTRLLKVCKNVILQLKAVTDTLTNLNEEEEEDDTFTFLYHPVVLQSICHAITDVCTLASTQYFSAASPAKFAAKICEVPVARIVHVSVQR